jgi:hypothetical protein
MADIKINDLLIHDIPGADLFSDSENFLRDLSDDEMDIQGGWSPLYFAYASSNICIGGGIVLTHAVTRIVWP